mmetsp:Transcript_39787/g.106099  ORF Transcript_39787/g.106099 Transcript_39787/m.106099 type:complete len:98 (+) Transcript_39787:2293-2586(+)
MRAQVTKGVVTAAVLSLVQQGRIDLSAPVAKYWPAFAAEGKDKITVEQVPHRCSNLQVESFPPSRPRKITVLCDWLAFSIRLLFTVCLTTCFGPWFA